MHSVEMLPAGVMNFFVIQNDLSPAGQRGVYNLDFVDESVDENMPGESLFGASESTC